MTTTHIGHIRIIEHLRSGTKTHGHMNHMLFNTGTYSATLGRGLMAALLGELMGAGFILMSRPALEEVQCGYDLTPRATDHRTPDVGHPLALAYTDDELAVLALLARWPGATSQRLAGGAPKGTRIKDALETLVRDALVGFAEYGQSGAPFRPYRRYTLNDKGLQVLRERGLAAPAVDGELATLTPEQLEGVRANIKAESQKPLEEAARDIPTSPTCPTIEQLIREGHLVSYKVGHLPDSDRDARRSPPIIMEWAMPKPIHFSATVEPEIVDVAPMDCDHDYSKDPDTERHPVCTKCGWVGDRAGSPDIADAVSYAFAAMQPDQAPPPPKTSVEEILAQYRAAFPEMAAMWNARCVPLWEHGKGDPTPRPSHYQAFGRALRPASPVMKLARDMVLDLLRAGHMGERSLFMAMPVGLHMEGFQLTLKVLAGQVLIHQPEPGIWGLVEQVPDVPDPINAPDMTTLDHCKAHAQALMELVDNLTPAGRARFMEEGGEGLALDRVLRESLSRHLRTPPGRNAAIRMHTGRLLFALNRMEDDGLEKDTRQKLLALASRLGSVS